MLSEIRFPDVFVSYAHEDADWVRNLVSRLRSEGFVVFFDQSSLRYGDDIPLLIEHALDSALRILFVVSDASLRSEWARFESTFDWSGPYLRGTGRLIPLRLAVRKLPKRLEKLKYVDFQAGDFETSFLQLVDALRRVDQIILGPVEVDNPQALASLSEDICHRIAAYYEFDANVLLDIELCCNELGKNALQYGTGPGEVAKVTATIQPTNVLLEVEDPGKGFELGETMARAVERLRREPTATGGRGLLFVFRHSDHLAVTPKVAGKLVSAYFSARRDLEVHEVRPRDLPAAASRERFPACCSRDRSWAYLLVRGTLKMGPRGEVGLETTLEKLKLVCPGLTLLAIDLIQCLHIDSSGLSELVQTVHRFQTAGIEVVLIFERDSRTYDLIRVCRLETLAPICFSLVEVEHRLP